MLLSVSKQNSFLLITVDLLKRKISVCRQNCTTCPSSSFSKEKGRVMSRIGGGCELLEQ